VNLGNDGSSNNFLIVNIAQDEVNKFSEAKKAAQENRIGGSFCFKIFAKLGTGGIIQYVSSC
jgi:DNA-binding IscR family transcriptional regulator